MIIWEIQVSVIYKYTILLFVYLAQQEFNNCKQFYSVILYKKNRPVIETGASEWKSLMLPLHQRFHNVIEVVLGKRVINKYILTH